ncbi:MULTISPECIES: efflux transporter outer membrane subunit [Variovorax]|jgi:outer membrane protein, multidrug efflux system|uniref:efflux transporter outer membrane subunit n=1 Tax=Variovorax TaxID=34072 RepID=UPI00086A4A4A|nr:MULTISPECIES: efflux transporter outer membrane subunit [Variovorax]MBN8757015.1 efflux transporter outer membrane subunit [Variovorax sp.]ODU13806.1 MAG: transporter [Variovorax sp. SCN 67-85]ODV21131.1 MAG: transporter [Variovorax sp. SCN 67-20]OJZ08398.1 MAG: transporter [Variovorax sp. 67-131]UKI10185.1 efflux transporter outer membrane subunit [Variovorax paradoxus]
MFKRAFPLRSLALSAMASAVLAGCVNLAPEYTAPASPVPQALPSSGVEAPTPIDVSWRSFFVEPRLRGTIELALANNRDLRVAALNIERARAQYGIARASLFPTVEAGAGGSRSRTPGSLSTGGEARIGSQYSADLGLTSYEIDLFGRVRNLGESALQSYFQTEETRRSTQISLIASVATAWLQLAADEQRLLLARNTLESQRKSFDLVQRSHRLGAQSGLALAQAQSTVDSARADAAAFDSQVEQDRNALALLVGAMPPADLLPAAPASDTAAPADAARLLVPPPDLPSSVLNRRPDVRAAEHALRASNADIGAARAAFFPRIALTASAGTASSTLSGLFAGGSQAWSFAPSISVPIFDGGANRANLRVAEAQQKIQIATYEKAVQTAFREVADALAERRTLAERLDAQRSLLGATSRSFELSQSLFRSGASSYLDVLDAQRAYYAAQQALIGLQLTEQTNRLTIYKTLGGGWEES